MSNQHKRSRNELQHTSTQGFSGLQSHDQQVGPSTDSELSVRGYEATLIYGQEAFAKKLRLPEEQGGQLMRWSGEDDGVMEEEQGGRQGEKEVWIDRYDILHLLSSLPSNEANVRTSSPLSSTGWSELPSDAEDTFFFSGDEGDDYTRGKKRRRMEAGRAERMEALRLRMEKEAEADEAQRKEAQENLEVWGGHDEEPPPAIRTLMEHTAKSLLTSPNPQVLELRILTHHAGDGRFSFLKGRYKNTWDAIKRGEKPKDLRQEASTSKGGLGGLMGDYGDSESEDSDEQERVSEPSSPPPLPPSSPPPEHNRPPSDAEPDGEEASPVAAPLNDLEVEEQEEQARALRREKARAWMAARKQAGDETTAKEAS